MTSENEDKFAGHAILELMGHRRLGGFVSETTLAGGAFLRIDVPGDVDGEVYSTQFYSPGSVYCLTPCSEEAAKVVARGSRTPPVHQWELPRPTTATNFACPRCGTVATRVCAHCDEPHPCSCMDDSDIESEERDDE